MKCIKNAFTANRKWRQVWSGSRGQLGSRGRGAGGRGLANMPRKNEWANKKA